jgi:hypothetical protein
MPFSLHRLEQCPSYVAWRAGYSTDLAELSRVPLKLPLQDSGVKNAPDPDTQHCSKGPVLWIQEAQKGT